MLITLIKIALIITLGIIFIQDITQRLVYWFLFPLVGIWVGILFYLETIPELFFMSVLLNLVFVLILLGSVFLYTKLKLKTAINQVIGLGDILLFIVLIFACTSISFMILLPSALIFSLVLHAVLSKNKKHKTVPLAGYMSLFFGITFLGLWFGIVDSLYKI